MLSRRAGEPGAEGQEAERALDVLLREAVETRQPHRRAQARGPRFALAEGGGPLRLRCTETEGTYGRERVEGLLCAGSLGETLVRLRLTMPQRSPPAADARGFAAAIAAALGGR